MEQNNFLKKETEETPKKRNKPSHLYIDPQFRQKAFYVEERPEYKKRKSTDPNSPNYE